MYSLVGLGTVHDSGGLVGLLAAVGLDCLVMAGCWTG